MTASELAKALAEIIGVEALAPILRDLLDLSPRQQREALAEVYADALRAQMESDIPTRAQATRRGGAAISLDRW